MFRWFGILGRYGTKTLFTLLALAVAAHAFMFLYRPFETGNVFATQFAISGVDVPVHFFIAGLALVLAPIQLSSALRRRWSRLHRFLGWLYTVSVLVGSVSGFSLALNAQGGIPGRVAFVLLALMWPLFTGLAIWRAISGDYAAHRRWMFRSVALTYAAVTLRVVLGTGLFVLKFPFVPVYIAAAWLGWMINLAICELILRWPAIRERFRRDNAVIASTSG